MVNPRLEFMLNYLYKKGEIGIVGAYYRNQMMIRTSKNPEEYEACCNERSSKMEGFFGVVKTNTELDGHHRKRCWKAFVWKAGITILAFVFAALICVQNGVYKHLGNITYIT